MAGKKIKRTGGAVQKPQRLGVHRNDKSPAGPTESHGNSGK